MNNRITPEELLNALTTKNHDFIINAVLQDPNILKINIDNGMNLIAKAGWLKEWHLIELIASLENVKKLDDSFRVNSAILYAVYYNDYHAVKRFIKLGLNSNKIRQFSDTGNNPLHCAVLKCNEKIIALLLKAGYSLSIKNKEEQTPICLAEQSNSATMRAALNAGWGKFYAEILRNNQLENSVNEQPVSFTWMALFNHNYELIKRYLSFCPEILTKKVKNNEPFYWSAIRDHQFDVIHHIAEHYLVKDDIIKLLQDNNQLNDALLLAVMAQRIDIAKNVLSKGAEINVVSPVNGATPLQLAIKQKNVAMIGLLLQYRPNLSHKVNDKLNVLGFASSKPSYLTAFSQALNEYCHQLSAQDLLLMHPKHKQQIIGALFFTRQIETLKNVFNMTFDLVNTAFIFDSPRKHLSVAIKFDYVDLAVSLLDHHGANILMNGDTAQVIDFAKKSEHIETLNNAWNSYFNHLITSNQLATELKKYPLPFLHMLLINNSTEQLKAMIACDQHIIKIDVVGKNCIAELAARHNLVTIIDTIIKYAKSDADKHIALSWALLDAVSENNISLATKLLKENADPNKAHYTTGVGCLHRAIKLKNPDMIALLLKHGANKNHKDKNDETPDDFANHNFEYGKTYNQGMNLFHSQLTSKLAMPILLQGQRQLGSQFYNLPDEIIDKIGSELQRQTNDNILHQVNGAKDKLTEISARCFIDAYPIVSVHSQESVKLFSQVKYNLNNNHQNKPGAINQAVTRFVNSLFNKENKNEPVQSRTTSLLLKYHLLNPNTVEKVAGGEDRYRLKKY